jgi:hypothetical protein
MRKSILFLAVALVAGLAGCAVTPAPREAVPAGRSAVTFRVENSLYMEARVFFDNTEIGRLADFLEGRGFIPAEPGEHEVILILCPSIRVMNEIITVPAGSVRVVTVK